LTGWTVRHAQSLLVRLAEAALASEDPSGRYELHDLAQDFARRLFTGEDQAQKTSSQQRLGDWYLATADQAARHVYPILTRLSLDFACTDVLGFDSTADAMAWLDAERHNLRAFVRYFADHGPVQRSCALVGALRGYIYMRGITHEHEDIARTALRAAESAADERGQSVCQLALGSVNRFRGDFHGAIEHFTAAAALAHSAGWDEGEASAHAYLGESYKSMFQPFDALRHASHSFAINEKIDNIPGMTGNHIGLGEIHCMLGNLAAAAHHQSEGIRLSRELNDHVSEYFACVNRATTLRLMGHFDAAIALLSHARTLLREIGVDHESMIDLGLADVYMETGRFDLAEEKLGTRQSKLDLLFDKTSEHSFFLSFGRLLRLTGRAKEGLRILTEATVGNGKASPTPADRIWMLTEIAEALIDLGRLSEAAGYCDEALQLSKSATLSFYPARTHAAAARLALASGDQGEAELHACRAVENAAMTGQRPQHARGLILLGQASPPERAVQHWEQALQICMDLQLPETRLVETLLCRAAAT
jgi:tetratricopeptide (TPR) repeat protein